MKIRSLCFLAAVLLTIAGCKKESETVDTTYPIIAISSADAFPKQCSIVKRGEKFLFKASLSDNVQLGSVSIDIHHNFDHHSHSTEVNDCTLEPIKIPVKPLLLIKDFPLPDGQRNYQIAQEIAVPADIDAGDYHFLIRLTDQAGWQTIKGLSIKIN
ncbi:DUF4625 domain-containing protein [Pedobacter polaris]|uniref:DUF4625 domain-containing protein n=1 Tax=Pedobacter polaris TaxID=2571273 RepID=A0A4U1CWL5_9SPHI|nr:DUF4625 domain-containing protein [Pedobacter polaris]TKC10709.1 DUF4625 domain-containing protein [Pedobacter polaris]